MELKDLLVVGMITLIIQGAVWYYFEVIREKEVDKKPNMPKNYASSDRIKIIGVYTIPNNKDVHLIELIINASPNKFDVIEFTQEDPAQPKDNWQVAYDEHYLNKDGTKIIEVVDNQSPTRIAFFIYYLKLEQPFATPFGLVNLPKPIALPKRLAKIIKFEEID
ncbi:MAG TPA: hypothetical protein VK338_06525 [Candidatus Nitrosocosmicus sp.]|nr:hypothetical protein [Candidatus Nitrosocosmicus sp.]